MYNIPYYKAQNQQEVLQFIRQHPFATLVAIDSGNFPVATHVPLLLQEREEKLYLIGHIMRNSDHHKALKANANTLVIFSGAHSYISASWYKCPQQASTWNYRAVHVKGLLTFLDEKQLLHILEETTALFENNPESPALFQHLPGDYVNRLAKGIEAFEIEVTSVEHVFKMSQNKDEESYKNIVTALQNGEENAREVAAIMEKKYHP